MGNITLGFASGIGGTPGALNLLSNLDVIHNGSGQLAFNRAVTGIGALTKTGSGTLAFTGGAVANAYSGLTTVSEGSLNLGKTAGTDAIAGNVLVNGTGTLTLSAANQIKNTSNVEVAAGIFALGANSETVNGVKLIGGAITSSTGILTSTTAYDLQSGSASAILAGAVGATKTTAGAVTLSGTNTYTGVTTISAGTFSVGSIGNGGVAGNLGQATNVAANLVFDGGTLQYTGANATSDRAFTINAGKTATIDTTNNISFAGATGTATNGALTKLGAGTLTLTGTNTYTGNTTISAGTLSMASNLVGSSPNIFIGNGATLTSSGGFSMTSGQSITGTGATGTINGNTNPGLTMNGNNTVSNNASGQLSLMRLSVYGSNNTITAGDIQSGVSGSSRGLNIGNGAAGSLTITGGSLTTNGNSTTGDILGSTSGSGVGTLTINGGSYTANSAQGLSIGFGAGSGTLTLTSGNVTLPNLTLAAVNNFSDAVVNLDGGIFTLGGLTVTSGRSNQVNFNGGTLKASATLPLGNGAGNVTFNVKNGGAIIDTNSNTVTISNPLVNFGGTSTGGLTKLNTGTLVLSGTNTYTGATAVSAGKLMVAGSIGNSAVTVSGAGTILATDAAASFGSTIAIENGAILTPGDATTAGTATVTGTSTFNNGSIFSWDIDDAGTGYDKLVSSNILGESTAGDAVFRIVASDALVTQNFWNATKTWSDIFTTDGTSAIADWATLFGNTVSVVNSSFTPITPAGGSFSVSGSILTWTAVPEPTSALAGLLLTAGLLRRRRQGNGRPVVS